MDQPNKVQRGKPLTNRLSDNQQIRPERMGGYRWLLLSTPARRSESDRECERLLDKCEDSRWANHRNDG